MRILILTQEENLYLPSSFAEICRHFSDSVVCIVSAPAMSTHGGAVKGFIRHLRLFGLGGTSIMVFRILRAKALAAVETPRREGPFHSIGAVARAFEIPFRKIVSVKKEMPSILEEFGPDLLISISCPQIIGKTIRERFSLGCINVHGAPLPKYRGLMPAFWVLRYNETRTAATVHDLADKLDNGAILEQEFVDIPPGETWDGLVRKTKAAGVRALIRAITSIESGTSVRKPNLDEESSYFSFPTKADRKAFLTSGHSFF
jgi:methionyl-tRNA formyltransferase